ncbi:MAG: hypothetical protein DRJ01_16300, partial [Bacteroidetes bacterium]
DLFDKLKGDKNTKEGQGGGGGNYNCCLNDCPLRFGFEAYDLETGYKWSPKKGNYVMFTIDHMYNSFPQSIAYYQDGSSMWIFNYKARPEANGYNIIYHNASHESDRIYFEYYYRGYRNYGLHPAYGSFPKLHAPTGIFWGIGH